MSGNGTFRIGIIGSGRIAGAYGEAAAHSALVSVTAVADLDEDASAALAARCEAVGFRSHQDLLGSGLVDGVLVSTPPVWHSEIVHECIEAGIPVICEKPFALTSEDAVRMVNAARRRKVPLTMASKYRYVPDVARAAGLVRNGLIGDVVEADICFAGRVDMSGRWNSDPAVSGGGVLIDNGAHAVDLVRFFLGPVTAVLATSSSRLADVGVEDNAVLIARTETCAVATIRLSWAYDSLEPAFLTLHGTTGSLRLGWQESTYRSNDSRDWLPFGAGYDKLIALRGQLEDFAAAVGTGTRLRIGDDDALASVAVIEAAYRAMSSGAWAAVPSIESLAEDTVELRLELQSAS